jgi:hypothetical protein
LSSSFVRRNLRGEGDAADRATKGKFVHFCAIADFPYPNRSVPTGREKALTVREKGEGDDGAFVGFPSSDEA